MKVRDRTKPYLLNILLSIDQFISAICGYDADTSISAALGEIQWLQYKGANIGWRHPLKAILQRSLDKIKDNHCLRSYEFELKTRNIDNEKLKAFLKNE